MPQLDFPPSVPGAVYVAPNGVTYTYDTSIGTGVWKATTSTPLSVTPGSISGTASVGSTLTYTPGVASGGSGGYTYAYQWKANGANILGATGLTYQVAPGNAGQSITVTITATDSATATANATTAPVVIPTALTVTAGSISAGTPTVGTALTYTPGVASGGTGGYSYTYLWQAGGGAAAGSPTNGTSYTPAAGDVGKTLTVTITATDSSSATANATTAPTVAVVAGTIPTASYSPSPSTGPTASNTVATGIWNGTADTLSSSGCIEFAVTTGAPVPSTVFSQSSTPVANGQTVTMRWRTGGTCTGAADGTAIAGTLSAASGGTNTYNFTVDTTPTNFSFAPLTNQPVSTAVSSASITLAGPNVTTYLTTTGGTLTSIEASIGTGAFTAIPASGTTMPVEPGQTIQIRGTTGGSNSTGYTAIVALGGVSTTWTATTAAPVPTIATPAITSPTGSPPALLNPALNTPAGIELLTTSSYTPTGGAGTPQTSSEWEVYRWTGGAGPVPPTLDPPGANYAAVTGSPFIDTTPPFTSQLVPQSALSVSSTYYARLRYRTTNATATDSSWSAWSSFATAASFAPAPGTALGGGYFGGQINDGGTVYNLIVAPAATGQFGGSTPSYILWKTSTSTDTNPPSQNEVYGKLATDFFTGTTYPAFNWAKSLNIGGFTDWYIPAKNELEILYFNLKPTATANITTSGINPNAVPARASNYTTGNPAQTTNALFQSGGSEAFSAAEQYWSSTETSGININVWVQIFNTGEQFNVNKSNPLTCARSVRRIAA